MEELIAMLVSPGFGSLATVDGGKPRVRPFAFMFSERGRFYFCTSSTKEVYRQLTECPHIEFTKTCDDMRWMRINGEIRFDDDIQQKKRCFQLYPMLKELYQTPNNPIFKVFYLEHGNASIDNMSAAPRVVLEF